MAHCSLARLMICSTSELLKVGVRCSQNSQQIHKLVIPLPGVEWFTTTTDGRRQRIPFRYFRYEDTDWKFALLTGQGMFPPVRKCDTKQSVPDSIGVAGRLLISPPPSAVRKRC